MRKFNTISLTNTVEEWVQAFNNNALSAADHTWYLGEMLFNGILYTGLETIGSIPIASLSNLNVSTASPQNLELDNFYIYFRDINKILLVDQVTFDLRPYKDGHPHFFYINSELGFRVSQQFKQKDNEVMLFRFILQPNEKFSQMYVTSQRFGSNVYDTADEYYLVKGCLPQPAPQKMRIKLGDGSIKRSGIKFDNHQVPDVYKIEDKPVPFNLRYITAQNKVDFNEAVIKQVIPNKILNYTTNTLTTLADGKFSVQRILYDVYSDCLVMQYGDSEYDDLRSALTAVGNVTYPFPYNELMFIPMGLMFIKSNCTDLADPEQCIMVQQLSTTIDMTQSTFFACDDYARGRIKVIQNEIKALEVRMADAERRITKLEKDLDDHIHDYNNPHKVTKTQVGLGKVENYSRAELDDYIGGRAATDAANKYVPINGDCNVNNSKNFTGHTILNTAQTKTFYIFDRYVTINGGARGTNPQGRRLYVGGSAPTDAVEGDFWLPDA